VLLIAAVLVLVLPPVYRARASFVTNGGSSLRLPGSLGGAGASALAGMAASFGVGPNSDPSESPAFYDELLHSRELLTRLLLSRFPDPRTDSPADSATLLALLEIRNKDPRRQLEIGVKQMTKSLTSTYDTKTNLVELSVDTEWPELSAQAANRTMELLADFNQEQRLFRARAKRVFVEQRVAEAQQELASTEGRLRAFYDQNRQWRTSPNLMFEEGRLRRQVDVASDLYLTLRREFETARIAEVNDAPQITIVDSAISPRKKQWPRYGVTLVVASVIGVLLGLLVAATSALFAEWRARHPDEAAELDGALAQLRRDMPRMPWSRRRSARTA
jgi:uncharacterized protein involved in exopolysaccharide biosynthesis